MKLTRRRKHSQRPSVPEPVLMVPNFTGQGGFANITFESVDFYYFLEPETDAEMRELLSQVHTLHHNFEEKK